MTSHESNDTIGRLWRFVTKDNRTIYIFGFDLTTWYAARQFAIVLLKVPYDFFTMDSLQVDEIPPHREYSIVTNGEIEFHCLTGISKRTVVELSRDIEKRRATP